MLKLPFNFLLYSIFVFILVPFWFYLSILSNLLSLMYFFLFSLFLIYGLYCVNSDKLSSFGYISSFYDVSPLGLKYVPVFESLLTGM